MANFLEAFEKTALYEGGYVNDPDDAGGPIKASLGITIPLGKDGQRLTRSRHLRNPTGKSIRI